jgi:hypothetical protein
VIFCYVEAIISRRTFVTFVDLEWRTNASVCDGAASTIKIDLVDEDIASSVPVLGIQQQPTS